MILPALRIRTAATEGVKPGQRVVVRDAFGDLHRRIATTLIVRGRTSFDKVWVAPPDVVERNGPLGRRGRRLGTPWPTEDVVVAVHPPLHGNA